MAAELKIIELDRELRMNADRIVSLRAAILSAALTGGFTAWVGLEFLSSAASIATGSCFALSVLLVAATGKTRVSLRAAERLFVSSGRIGRQIGSERSAITDQILWLEYRENTWGPDHHGSPEGLYAVVNGGAICLLPDLDAQRTHMAIGRIEHKFPELQRRWARALRLGEDFTALRLSDPTDRT